MVYFGSNIQVGADTGLNASLLTLDTVKRVEAVEGVAAAFGGVNVPAKPGQTIVVSFGIPDYIAGSQRVRTPTPSSSCTCSQVKS